MPTPNPSQLFSHSLKGNIFKLFFILALLSSERSFAENKQQRLIKETSKEFLTSKATKNANELNASHYKVITRPLDKNLHLTPCKTPIKIKDLSPMKYGHQLLKVQCENHWDVLVTGMIHIYVTALVSKKKLPQKHQIQESDIDWKEVDISQLTNDYLIKPDDAIGKYSRITLPTGTPLSKEGLSDIP